MEHSQAAEQESQETIASLVASLGITDDMTCDEPPAWVTQELTDDQRATFAKLVLHSGNQGLGSVDTIALLLLKLGLQPGLPPQASGYLAFTAAELYAGFALNRARSGLGAFDLTSVLGLVRRTIQTLDANIQPEEEDLDQDVEHSGADQHLAINGAAR